MIKRIALFGSTGSIGRQSLEVARRQGFTVAALGAQRNVELLERQVLEFRPALVAVGDEAAAEALSRRLSGLEGGPKVLAGPNAAAEAAAACGADMALNAIVGFAGLDVTLAALAAGMDVALANKESLVAGGSLVMEAQKAAGTRLLPVDSEHSAIFQCLQDPASAKALERIILTASGGPFYGKTAAELQNVTKEEALAHPNWSMGAKITVDSATLMNKGLEFIEAMWLFGLAPQQIDIVVQRESIIHSMVEFADGSVLAQLGQPDMRLPIQYALTWPRRLPGPAPRLDFSALPGLSFGRADEESFQCLAACRRAAEKGGLAPCAANGANEEAVALFLRDEIAFLEIGRLVAACVDKESYAGGYSLADVRRCDAEARRFVRERAIRK